jgi:hypothetical protein
MLPTGEPVDKTVGDMTPRELAREWTASTLEDDKLLRPYRMRAVRGQVHQRLALPSRASYSRSWLCRSA